MDAAIDVLGACPAYTSISMGTSHLCAVDETAHVVCEGSNEWGQVGRPEGSGQEGVVPGLEDVAQIVSGERHTCARKNDGSVWCWGFNAMGQIGDGTTGTGWRSVRYSPAQVLGLDDAVHLISGDSYMVATLRSGEYVWWGDDLRSGQRWDGVSAGLRHRRAVPFLEFAGAEQIFAGASHVCGLYDDGSVSCLGRNTHGQLGREIEAEGDARPGRMEVEGVVTDVALGWSHSCVLRAGRVTCLGWNIDGQLGVSDSEAQGPVTPFILRGREDVVSIVAASEYTCALREGGEVSCWGETFSAEGQILADDAVGIEAAIFSVLIEDSEGRVSVVGRGRTSCVAL